MRAFTVVGLGEVLWDLLPGGRQLGGAPANFAYHAAALGDRGIVASRVGADLLGDEVCAHLAALGLTTRYLQRDPSHTTGTVHVQLDADGQPDFTITEAEDVAHPGYTVQVIDTVGTGDAFAAAMAHHWLRGASLEAISDAANRLGAYIATQAGAPPSLPPDVRRQVLHPDTPG